MSTPGLAFPFSKEVLFFINSSRARRQSLLIFETQFPMLLFFCVFFNTTGNEKWSLRNKMDNPRLFDEETIPLVQDVDNDNYDTPNTSRVDETSFTEPYTTEATSTLRLKQKVKR